MSEMKPRERSTSAVESFVTVAAAIRAQMQRPQELPFDHAANAGMCDPSQPQ